jgi:hypothetical protein
MTSETFRDISRVEFGATVDGLSVPLNDDGKPH